MKKAFLLTATSLLISTCIIAQSVGINNTTPDASAILDIKSSNKGLLISRMTTTQRTDITTPAKGLMVFDITTNSCWFHNGTAWVALSPGSSTNYWTANGATISNNNGGNVGIGTANPLVRLQVGDNTGLGGGYDFAIGDGGGRGIGIYQNFSYSQITSKTNIVIFPKEGVGNIGINTASTNNRLQIGDVNSAVFTDFDFAIGRNNNAMAIYQRPNFTNIVSTSNITINPKNATGYVGINVGSNPSNKLQIGSMGAAGYNGNDIAFGNGTQVTAISQTSTASQFASNTDFVFLPRYGTSAGRVGINTSTPRAPLDVATLASPNNPNPSDYYSYLNLNSGTDGVGIASLMNVVPNVSIISGGRVLASEFDAYSDARIKDIIGISNASNDLKTINAIQVKDYRMKDKVKYGNQQFKKVIAQEVEKVYPQVVSRHTDFIPNVYQLTNKITKSADGYLLSFAGNHHISNTAKRIQILIEGDSSMKQVNIISIPSANEVVVEGADIKGDKLFVYGEEVDDFRTVDYEGLTTLNISATQELSRQLQLQNKKIAELKAMVELMQLKPTMKSVKD